MGQGWGGRHAARGGAADGANPPSGVGRLAPATAATARGGETRTLLDEPSNSLGRFSIVEPIDSMGRFLWLSLSIPWGDFFKLCRKAERTENGGARPWPRPGAGGAGGGGFGGAPPQRTERTPRAVVAVGRRPRPDTARGGELRTLRLFIHNRNYRKRGCSGAVLRLRQPLRTLGGDN